MLESDPPASDPWRCDRRHPRRVAPSPAGMTDQDREGEAASDFSHPPLP